MSQCKLSPGDLIKEGAYKVLSIDDKRITIQRTTIKRGDGLVRISQAMIEKTRKRLESGEAIEYRKISYTVAIEYVVVLMLADIITCDDTSRTYSIRKG